MDQTSWTFSLVPGGPVLFLECLEGSGASWIALEGTGMVWI